MNVENIGKVTSFTSANALPIKIFKDKRLLDSISSNNFIPPYHVQLVPTNVCNLKCTYCSFKEADKKISLSNKDLDGIVEMCKDLGTKAITITGGGEPLLHPDINHLIWNIKSYGMKVGMVSNGKNMEKLSSDSLNNLTWLRISFDTNRSFDDKFVKNLNSIVTMNHNCDLAFSYVVAGKTNGEDFRKLVSYANNHNFSHVRVVEDLFQPGFTSMEEMKSYLEGLDTSRIVFQGKKDYCAGTKDCYISLIKPFIAADGYIYPCCGVTYAQEHEQKKEPKNMRMGHWSDLPSIIRAQKNYNGNSCTKCYYPEYNAVLKALKTKTEHKEFI